MKKNILLVLVLALLLAGCAAEPEETLPTTVPQPTETEPTEPPQSYYVADSPMERGTAGAVRQYAMEQTVTGISAMDTGLLVCTDGSRLCVLDRTSMSILTERELECTLDWDSGSLVINGDRLAYFDSESGSYQVLDSNLIAQSAAVMTTGVDVEPVISSSLGTIYYADTDGIHTLNLTTGASRILRQEHEQVIDLDGVYFGDGLLRYTRQLSDGTCQDCFISAENGRLYDTATFRDELTTWGNRYATVLEQDHPFGTLYYLLTGQWGVADYVLPLSNGWDSVSFPGDGLALVQKQSAIGLVLSCYDLEAGMLVSQVTLPQIYELYSGSYAEDGNIWLWTGKDGEFYCWDRSKSAMTDRSFLLEDLALVTDDDSDADYRLKARTVSEQYQVKILLADGSNRTDGLNYDGYPDYRAAYYDKALDLLADTLAKFPEGFLKTLAKQTSSGTLTVRLTDDYDPATGVNSISGDCDLTDRNITLSVSMCPELEELFLHTLYSAIETKILNRCDDLDKWYKRNPEEFEYGKAAMFGQYAEAENRYFLNSQSMESPREDRAQIFLHAMQEGNGELFSGEPMQKKLRELCRLIRKVYKLDDDMILPWEQYLSE